MPLNCPQAVSKLKAYQKQHQDLKQQFSDFMSQAPFLPDVKWDEPFMSSPYYKDITNAPKNIFDNLYNAKEEARKKLEELKELSGWIDFKEFVVKDALNPYAEGLRDGGITDPELIAERKDIKVNLQELLTQDKDAYKQAQLTEWVNALPDNIGDFKLTKQQLENLKSRIEQGEIPIFMPGRLAQLKGLSEAIDRLKPELIKDGQKKNVADTYHNENIDKLIFIMIQIAELRKNNKSLTVEDILALQEQLESLIKDNATTLNLLEGTVRSIPEEPYIFTTKSSQSNSAGNRNKDLTNQRNELEKIKALNPELLIDCLSIGEYLALQNRFTNRLASYSPQELIPLDHDKDASTGVSIPTRFINLPFSGDSGIVVFWAGGDFSKLIFEDWRFMPNNSREGFRLSVRI